MISSNTVTSTRRLPGLVGLCVPALVLAQQAPLVDYTEENHQIRRDKFEQILPEIMRERDDYYDILERTQRGTMDVSAWQEWFLSCLGRAIDDAQATLSGVLAKARFWERAARVPLNDRQRLVLGRLVDGGFKGKLTTSKWGKLAKCSQDTALRDIQELVGHGIMVRSREGGRSTSYELVGGLTATQ